jgi:hypothetical protein
MPNNPFQNQNQQRRYILGRGGMAEAQGAWAPYGRTRESLMKMIQGQRQMPAPQPKVLRLFGRGV